MGNDRFASERELEMIRVLEASLPALRSFARGLSSSNTVADDIVQSACERALERLDQVTEIAGMKSWLNRIVYTQWQDVLRKRQRRKTKLFHFWDYQNASRSGRKNQGEDAHNQMIDIRRALDRLSEEHRAAVVLVSMLGYEYEEAAEILDIPVGTLASRVARARMQLADYLNSGKRNTLLFLPKKEIIR